MTDTKKCEISIPKIVVVGGGAGGIELVARLAKKYKNGKAKITLVDTSPIHLWKPLLHEVASGTLNSYEDELNYLAYARTHQFQFCQGTLDGLNRTKQEITLAPIFDENHKQIVAPRTLPYDILILAIGSISNDFNIPGVREHCLFLDSSKQAAFFQQYFIKTMMHFSSLENNENPLSIAIVGGGATGVELAAELHFAIGQMANYGFSFDPKKVSINLIEASDRLLPALSPKLSNFVKEQLTQLGVSVYTNEQVSEVTTDGLYTKSGKFIPAVIKTWAAGIKAPDVLKNLDGLEVNKINQLIVKPTLQTTIDPKIFSLGDCAYCLQEKNNTPVPPRAQSAHQQASFLVKAIQAYLTNKPLPHFVYHDYGSLISLSHYETIGNLMGRMTKSMMIEGKLARLAYLSLYKMHQVALYGPWKVTIFMLANLLTRRLRPRLKLH